MRKLLLGTTALVASGALLANAAVADVSISAATEWSYSSRSSNVTANDGTSFGTDSEIKFSFSNKTDSGLSIGYVVELESDDTNTDINESSLSISGGFGKVVLGENDSVADNYGVASTDLPSEESSPTVASASIGVNTDISGMEGDLNKVSYHLPAMGGLTAGASFRDSGAVGSTDTTTYGFNYKMDANGTAITIGGATATTEAATTDTDAQNLGVKIVSGNLSFIASQSHLETADDDIESTGAAISYTMANGMVLVAHTMKSEDDLEAGEEYTKSGVELQYKIAAGLTAVINVDDYEYTAATTPRCRFRVLKQLERTKMTQKRGPF
jgi:outer membrane protein OmpU